MDFLGNAVTIGDYVAFARNPYADLILGKVVGFTAKGFKVIRRNKDGKWNSRYWNSMRKDYEVVLAYQCVKIDYKDEKEA